MSAIPFTGEIYLHTQDPNGQVTSQLLPAEPLTVDRLFSQTKAIAEATGRPYIILYSQATPGQGRLFLSPIAYQTKDGIESLATAEITQADILPAIEPSWTKRTIENREALAQFKKVLREIATYTADLHYTNKTPFHLKQIARLNQVATQRRQAVFESPKVPRRIPGQGDLQQRKQALLEGIVQTLSELSFKRGVRFQDDNTFLGFSSYQDFLDFQRDYLRSLDDEQIRVIEFLVQQVFPVATLLDEESETIGDLTGTVFDADGHFVFISPR